MGRESLLQQRPEPNEYLDKAWQGRGGGAQHMSVSERKFPKPPSRDPHLSSSALPPSPPAPRRANFLSHTYIYLSCFGFL